MTWLEVKIWVAVATLGCVVGAVLGLAQWEMMQRGERLASQA